MNCDDLASAIRSSPLRGWSCAVANDLLRIQTPLRYPDGGTVELFVEERGDRMVVTDLGEAFRFLESSGVDPLRSQARERMISIAMELGGATLDEGAFEMFAADRDAVFPLLVKLGQVVTRVADLSLHAKGALSSSFSDSLADYIREQTVGVEVRRRVQVEGQSDKHEIDIVTRSASRGVSVIEGMSAETPLGANAQAAFTIKKFADIAAIGSAAPHRFAVLSDENEAWTTSLRQQLSRFSTVIDWGDREELARSV